jgi:hypothetical protein
VLYRVTAKNLQTPALVLPDQLLADRHFLRDLIGRLALQEPHDHLLARSRETYQPPNYQLALFAPFQPVFRLSGHRPIAPVRDFVQVHCRAVLTPRFTDLVADNPFNVRGEGNSFSRLVASAFDAHVSGEERVLHQVVVWLCGVVVGADETEKRFFCGCVPFGQACARSDRSSFICGISLRTTVSSDSGREYMGYLLSIQVGGLSHM